MSYDESAIEIEGYGRISHTGKIPVYELLDGETVTESSISKVVLGKHGSFLCDRGGRGLCDFDQDTGSDRKYPGFVTGR